MFWLAFAVPAMAQIRYEPGFFMDNSGTTIECLIRNVAWKSNPRTFEYRLKEDGEVQKRTIEDTKEFTVGTYKYKRYKVEIDRSNTNLNDLPYNRQPEWSNETLFLKTLIAGNVNLYQYEEGNLIKYFTSTGNHETAEQLIFKQFKTSEGKVTYNNAYRQQLFMLLKSNQLKASDFENVDYTGKDLVALFATYNHTESSDYVNLRAKQNKSIIRLAITTGASFANASTDNVMDSGRFEFDQQLVFTVGLEAEYIMAFNQKKWALFIAPNYQSYAATGRDGSKDVAVEYKYFEIPAGLRHYIFLNNNSRIFINAGYALTINTSSSKISYGAVDMYISNSSHIFAGAGFSYKDFSLEVRHTFTRGLLDQYQAKTAQYSATGAILSYKFL
jgi:hypothetical protein